MKNTIYQNNYAFTVLEVVMVVAIFAILLSSATIITTQRTSLDALTAQSMAVVDLIDQAHNFSVSGYEGEVWSIRSVAANSTICTEDGKNGGCFILFKGTNYGLRDPDYDRIVILDNGVYIERSFTGLHFNKASGYTDSDQEFLIESNIGKTKTVYLKKTGLVYYTD